MIEFEDSKALGPIIKVMGVGGGGGNAINNMVDNGISGVEFLAANTDVQALEENRAIVKLQLGQGSTKGLGAGAKPEVGAGAAKESIDRIEELLAGADMVFVAAGMGGGTGTGAAPIIADVARRQGALTVGVVTKPFTFEGARRRKQAERGIEALKQSVDTLITVPNDRLLELADADTSVLDAFKMADRVLLNAVRGISDIITQKGVINVDFADAVSVMSDQGLALMGIGRAAGDGRAVEAAHMAVSSPLLEDVSVDGATGILVNVTGGPSLTLLEVNSAIALITEVAHEDANVIFGYVVDENMGDEVAITVIATGFDRAPARYDEPERESHAALPVAVQQRADPDVPTYIRRGWQKDSERKRGAVISMLPPVEEDENIPLRATGSSDVVAAEVAITDVGSPAQQEIAQASRAHIEARRERYTPPSRSEFSSVLEEDEYDIPAFLRRNAE